MYIYNDRSYEISYDRNRNYKDRTNPQYIPPYSQYQYVSIYEGVILEIHLVDHCNLCCA
jgi:hypothetical protein